MLISSKAAPRVSPRTATLAEHWPEYASEVLGLCLFMISACTFGTLLAHPDSPVVRLVRNPTLLRTLMGMAMGSTSAALVYSKFGKRSGAHLNPSTTLIFLRLGKVEPIDALFYISAHRRSNLWSFCQQHCAWQVAGSSDSGLCSDFAWAIR